MKPMRTLFTLPLLLFTLVGVSHASGPDDIYLQSKMDDRTVNWLLEKTRHIFVNTEMGDIYNGFADIDTPIDVGLEEFSKDANYLLLKDIVLSTFNRDLKDSFLRIRIPKIDYHIDKIDVAPKKVTAQDPYFLLSTDAGVHGLKVSLSDGIFFDLMTIDPITKEPKSLISASIDQPSVEIPSSLPPLKLAFSLQAKRDALIEVSLKNHDLNLVNAYFKKYVKQFVVQAGPNHETLSTQHMKVNPFQIQLNSMTRTIEFEAFKPFLQEKIPTILPQVLTLVGKIIQKNLGPKLLGNIFNTSFVGGFDVSNSSLYTRFSVQKLSQASKDQIRLGILGDQCTGRMYELHREACAEYEPKNEPARPFSAERLQLAQKDLTDHIQNGSGNVALSISEEYVNTLLTTTQRTDLWTTTLAENKLELGPKGAFVVFDKVTQKPELILDVIYKEKVKLRFPLKFSTAIHLTSDADGLLNVAIELDQSVSTADQIIHGIPEYELPSKLIFFMKKKIAKMILKMTAKITHQTVVEMKLSAFKNMELEKSWYEATPYGRMNLYFKTE